MGESARGSRLVGIGRAVGLSVLGLVLVVYIGLPVAMAVAAVWPSRAEVGPPPPGFRDTSLATADGVTLGAWYAPPRNAAAVIVVHGSGESRERSRRLAEVLVDRGYGVLAIDLRGHGQSGGTTNRLGWQGTRDVRAAVDFLLAQPGVSRIGGFGWSMGGEVMLGAGAECPEIRAIVADGATRRSLDELTALPAKRPLAETFVPRVMYAAVGILANERPPTPLLAEMEKAQATSYLFVAAGDNELEVAFNRLFAQRLGSRAELWVVPGVSHVGAYARYSEEYEQRVLAFLDLQLRPE